jgi:hypothetical protein
MSELGWDIDNRQGFAEQYREVHEDRVKVAGQTKPPDYSFRVGGSRKFFLEAKKPAVDIKNNWEPAYQLRRYAWSAKLCVSMLTDFEEFAVYDARNQPRQLEKASVARREFIHYTQYPDRWDFLSGTFSKDAVLKGEFDRYCETKKGRGAQLFDDAFLGEIEEWRKGIAGSLARNNPSLDEPALNFAVQRIIDRIIFLRIAEDRGTETVGQLQALLSGERVYPRLLTLFNRADERYNSGLFHFAKEPDRDEAPDTLTPTLHVDDKTLKGIIKALYYRKAACTRPSRTAEASSPGSFFRRRLRDLRLRRGQIGALDPVEQAIQFLGVFRPATIRGFASNARAPPVVESHQVAVAPRAQVPLKVDGRIPQQVPVGKFRVKLEGDLPGESVFTGRGSRKVGRGGAGEISLQRVPYDELAKGDPRVPILNPLNKIHREPARAGTVGVAGGAVVDVGEPLQERNVPVHSPNLVLQVTHPPTEPEPHQPDDDRNDNSLPDNVDFVPRVPSASDDRPWSASSEM